MKYKLIEGNCIDVMANAKSESVHACVMDPPYGIEFRGKSWDSPTRMVGEATGISGGFQRIPAGVPRPDMSKTDPLLFQEWCTAWAEQALRVLKPGGHILAFGGTRMFHRLAAGIEDAGFEIRDQLMWLQGQGMPKGRDLSPKIVKAGGDPEQWNGWQTCLKPMHEPIVLARKPLGARTTPTGRISKVGMSVAENLVTHGLGALNVDGCSIGDYQVEGEQSKERKGRMPGNVIIDEQAAEMIDAEAVRSRNPSRFFFIPKVGPEEKTAGIGDAKGHPTTKPIALMEWLIKLVTPEGGIVLDPFMGSGSTGIAALQLGRSFVGIEREAEYMQIARARIAHWAPEAQGSYVPPPVVAPTVFEGAGEMIVNEPAGVPA